jgi:hypothetical protein
LDDEVAVHLVPILGRDKPHNDEVVASAAVDPITFAPVGNGRTERPEVVAIDAEKAEARHGRGTVAPGSDDRPGGRLARHVRQRPRRKGNGRSNRLLRLATHVEELLRGFDGNVVTLQPLGKALNQTRQDPDLVYRSR